MIEPVLFKNANVFNFEALDFIKGDLLIKNGKIYEIAPDLKTKDLKVIDLNDRYLLPGLIDSHIHLISYGKQLSTFDLSTFSNLIEMLEFLKRESNSSIIIARGWNDDSLNQRPERSHLDEFFPDRPAILIRKCGHLAVVNTCMIKKFNLSEFKTPKLNPENGVIVEDALNRLMKLIETNEKADTYLEKAKESLLNFGITTVCSNDITLSNIKGTIETLSKFKGLRIFDEITVNSSSDIKLIHDEKLLKKYSDFFSVSSIKTFADGSFGARTAALNKSYTDDPENMGILLKTNQELSKMFSYSREFGFNISIHSIGDRAIGQIVETLQRMELDGKNMRIIHFQIADEILINKVKENGVRVTVQPIFKLSDQNLIERIFDNERRKQTYPFIQLKNHDILLSSSSDAPVESPNPYIGMKILIDEGFSEFEALKTYTLNAAKILNTEKTLGSIEKGKFADFCAFKENPLENLKEDPENLLPDLVVLNGEIVFSRIEK